MDFSAGPWPWIVLAVSLTGLLLWFAREMIARGLEFHRAATAEQQPGRDDEVLAELRAIAARMERIEHHERLERHAPAEAARPRAVR